jgi:hypothetical protein
VGMNGWIAWRNHFGRLRLIGHVGECVDNVGCTDVQNWGGPLMWIRFFNHFGQYCLFLLLHDKLKQLII